MRNLFLLISLAFANTKPIICLDPGHGGVDEGAKIRFPYCTEKKLALQCAAYTKQALEELGYRVRLTRARDIFVSLPKRCLLANRAKCDLFVSLHFNSCPNAQVKGIEIYYTDEKDARSRSSKKLGELVQSKIFFRTNSPKRGVRSANFVVTRDTKMPSILIEGGFLSNAEELSDLRKKIYMQKLAKGISDGIDRFAKRMRLQS